MNQGGGMLILDKAACDLEYGPDSIFTESVKTLELGESFEEPDGIHSLFSMHSAISDNSKLQLSSSSKSCKL